MKLERLRRIETVFGQALDVSARSRASLLDKVCAGDETLRTEVEALLSQHEAAGDFMEPPAFASRSTSQSGVADNDRISHYRILRKIGSGGMGTVYEAEDVRLRRRVALKFLADEFAEDAQCMERFRVEARAASALNHPNICTIYEVDEVGGRQFIAMEMLDGQTLGEMIDGKALEIKTIIELGVQIASAIDAAHAKGIAHRDIKPANLFVTTQRQIKILDFGIAKRTAMPHDYGTTFAHRTQTGMVVGTIGYISPEQLRGEAVDCRSDIFALGCVLYEMITGQRAFERPSLIETAYAILNEEHPAVSQTSPGVPLGLDRVVDRCLEKSPDKRFQSAADLAFALRNSSTLAVVIPNTAAASHLAASITKLKWKRIIPAAAALLMASAAGAYYLLHRSPKLTDRDTIVLAGFTNTTGDPVFDGTLRQGMTVQLQQSPFLSLISDERIQKSLALMSQPADAHLTPALGREICQRTGSAAVLDGSIASLGTQYVLGLRAVDCVSGKLLDAEQAQASRKEDVLASLDQMASRFRTRIGESLATIQEHNTPLAEATTSSLEALKAFSAGQHAQAALGDAAAMQMFQRAVEIDPQFAIAYAWLGRNYGDIDEPALSAKSTTRAYELRNRASDLEKFYITSSYELQVTGNLEKARQISEAWEQTYPRDPGPRTFLAGIVYSSTGQYEKAVEELSKGIQLDPDFAFRYYALGADYRNLGRLDDAERVLQQAADRKLEIPDYVSLRYQLAFLRNDHVAMQRELALSKRLPLTEFWLAHEEAFTLAYSGHLERANQTIRHAADIARQINQPDTAALYEIPPAVWQALYGDAAAAKLSAMLPLKHSKDLYVEYDAALALALAGDTTRSRTIADDMQKRFPEDSCLKLSYMPTLEALYALNQGQPAAAIEALLVAAPHELGFPRSAMHGAFGALYPIYVRGLAYLAWHKGAEAAIEFQKILDHRGIVINDPIGALAHRQLGRAYAMAGDEARATQAYSDFLTLWRDADPGIPILLHAKKELASMPR